MSKEIISDTALNSNNTDTTTSSLNVVGIDIVGFHIKEASGNHAGAIWRMYCSPDNLEWFQTSLVTTVQINNQNKAEAFDTKGTQYVKFKIDTVSTLESTEDITIIV